MKCSAVTVADRRLGYTYTVARGPDRSVHRSRAPIRLNCFACIDCSVSLFQVRLHTSLKYINGAAKSSHIDSHDLPDQARTHGGALSLPKPAVRVMTSFPPAVHDLATVHGRTGFAHVVHLSLIHI